jgi:hypothetical protein
MISKRRRRGLPERAAPVVALLLALGLACKGKGNNGDDVIPCTSITYAGSIGTPAAGDVSLLSLGSSCDSVDISALVTNLSGIFTIGFEVDYPSSVIAYQSFTAGPLLLQGSPTIAPLFLVHNDSPGVLMVSGTRFRPDSSVSATGNAIFITFHFARVASGSGAVDFSGTTNQIIDENGAVVAASFGPGHGGVVQVP